MDELELQDILIKFHNQCNSDMSNYDPLAQRLYTTAHTEAIKSIKELHKQAVLEAQYKELTGLGKLYRGKTKPFLTHYSERYNYLKTEIEKKGAWL